MNQDRPRRRDYSKQFKAEVLARCAQPGASVGCESRAGEHARNFLGDWKGALTCDDFAGYKALIASGVT